MKALTTDTKRTIAQIQGHPTTHNLEWRDVRKMFEHLGEVHLEHNGNLKVTLGEKCMVFQSRQDTNTLTENEVHEVRRFLHEAGIEQ